MRALGRISVRVPKGQGQPLRLYPIFDVHLGNPGCADQSFRSYVSRAVADPCARVLIGGDLIDAIGYRDKRFDPRCVPEWLRVRDLASLGSVLLDYAVEILRPLKGRILCAAWGNHEDSLFRDTQSWERWGHFCEAIGAPDAGVCGIMDIVFSGGHTERVVVHHGAGAAATAGGKINRVRKTLDDFPGASLVFVGHLHDQVEHRRTGIDADAECREIVDRTRLGLMCGTWLRTYTRDVVGYGEVRGYSPVPLGNPVVEIDPATGSKAVRW